MAQQITGVTAHSPAARAGLRAGDELLKIDGRIVIDFIDYQALSAERAPTLTVRRDGVVREVRIRKDEYAPLGLDFARPMMSGMHMCLNHCLFCFVDQLPENVRPTMRLKDDDWRMSLMMGNYVTLTNVPDCEIDRIIARHASPLYISVHTVDPELRSHMLGTPRGARLMDQLTRLSAGGISFHTQAVLCPGINDGARLEETISVLSAIPGALSLALVPVGLTGHREGLAPLRKYTCEEARAVIEAANRWREKLLKTHDTRFVFPADEFYLAAGIEPPADEEYEDYGQIDDGVGLLRLLDTEFSDAWSELPERERRHTPDGIPVTIACGVSARDFLADLMEKHPVTGLSVRVVAVENRFFGPTVTVSGLVTGGDLTERVAGEPGRRVLITECMLRDEGDRFLDDMTLAEAEERLGRSIVPVGRRGEDLLCALINARNELGG